MSQFQNSVMVDFVMGNSLYNSEKKCVLKYIYSLLTFKVCLLAFVNNGSHLLKFVDICWHYSNHLIPFVFENAQSIVMSRTCILRCLLSLKYRSKIQSFLSLSLFMVIFIFWVVFIFGSTFFLQSSLLLGLSSFQGLSSFLGVSSFLWSSSFLG